MFFFSLIQRMRFIFLLVYQLASETPHIVANLKRHVGLGFVIHFFCEFISADGDAAMT